jgi:hypothetical protein
LIFSGDRSLVVLAVRSYFQPIFSTGSIGGCAFRLVDVGYLALG